MIYSSYWASSRVAHPTKETLEEKQSRWWIHPNVRRDLLFMLFWKKKKPAVMQTDVSPPLSRWERRDNISVLQTPPDTKQHNRPANVNSSSKGAGFNSKINNGSALFRLPQSVNRSSGLLFVSAMSVRGWREAEHQNVIPLLHRSPIWESGDKTRT